MFLYARYAHESSLLSCKLGFPNYVLRSKGLTEQGLASLGYDDVIVFRPGFLVGTDRKDSRIAETIFT
jgi:hypothetical protein